SPRSGARFPRPPPARRTRSMSRRRCWSGSHAWDLRFPMWFRQPKRCLSRVERTERGVMSDYQPYSGENESSWSNQPPVPGGPSGPRASFGTRLGAWIIDFLIVAVVSFILVALLRGVGTIIGDRFVI